MADLKNIALTIQASQVAADLRRSLGITELMDVIRIGFAYAIRSELDLQRDSNYGTRGGSNYDTGGLDEDGLMAETLKIYYPGSEVALEPYRAIEVLMNKGIRLLGDDLRNGTIGSVGDLVVTE